MSFGLNIASCSLKYRKHVEVMTTRRETSYLKEVTINELREIKAGIV